MSAAVCPYLRHLQITKLVPQILDRVQSNERSTKCANPLDAADTANADAGAEQPETPLWAKRVMSLVMELAPAKHSRESEEQEHAVQ
jgi:hypothetical protein